MAEPVRARVLAAVRRGDITRRHSHLHWWITETERRTLTAAERMHLRALIADGVVRFWRGGGQPEGIGGFEVVPGQERHSWPAGGESE